MCFYHQFRALIIILAIACGSVFFHGRAMATPRVFLEDMTWTELRDGIASGATTIIIPVGGTEQSGPLIALGKHNVRVKALAGKIAEALGNTVVAPVVAYVPEGNITPPTEHMKFPGTITVSHETFQRVIESAALGFKQNGFTTIVLLGDHGGYQADLATVASRLNKTWKKANAKAVFCGEYYRAAQDAYAAALLTHGIAKTEIGTHAGLADTSLMLAVDPSLVRSYGLPSANNLDVSDGVYGGDPTRSSAELGRLGVDLVVNQSVAAIRLAIQAK